MKTQKQVLQKRRQLEDMKDAKQKELVALLMTNSYKQEDVKVLNDEIEGFKRDIRIVEWVLGWVE